MCRSRFACVLVVVLLASPSAMAAAQEEIAVYGGGEDMPQVWEEVPEGCSAWIAVDHKWVFDIPGPAAGVPLAVRAKILNCRLTEILSAHLTGPVYVRRLKGKPTIYVGPYRLITIYPSDEGALGTSARAIAKAWMPRIEQALQVASPGAPLGPATGGVAAAVPLN